MRRFILAALMLLSAACIDSTVTGIDTTPMSIQVTRYVCCGDDGHRDVIGWDEVEFWIQAGATLCVLKKETPLWWGIWVIEQIWECHGTREIFSRRHTS